MKLLGIVGILLLLAGVADARPFLVCDPDPAAEFYLVSIDGGEMVTVPAPLRYDLGPLNITDGHHRFDVQAGNVWGSSEPSPLDFTKTPVSDVTGLGLSSE